MSKILILIFFLFTFAHSYEKITLQLKWLHQFQFAGYYAAKEKGFYQEVGLDVQIKQRDLKYNNIQQVIDDEAQYGIADSVILLYRAKKEPVVIVSPIFQHSPSVLLSLKSSGIDSPYKLNNKKTIFYNKDTDGFGLLAMFKKLNVKPNLIRIKQKTDYTLLMKGITDTYAGYLTNEPFYFKEKGIDLNIINPSNYGLDLYGDMLITNEKEARNHPDRVLKFKEATLKGWEYALNHKEEIIQLIKNKYAKNKSIEHLRYEANAIEQIIQPKTTPLGTFDEGRLKYTLNLYQEYGLIKNDIPVSEYIFQNFNKKRQMFSEEEIKYIKNNPVIEVAGMRDYPPFSYIENNKQKGYSIDYINMLAKIAGLKIKIVSGKTWAEFLQMLKKAEIDVIPHIGINEDRKKSILFTDFDYINFSTGLVSKQTNIYTNMKQLTNKTLAVAKGTFLDSHLHKNFPSIRFLQIKNSLEGLNALLTNKADAYIGSLPTANYYIQKNWLNTLQSGQIEGLKIPTTTSLYIGVPKSKALLKSILEKSHSQLAYDEIQKIKNRWMNEKDTSAMLKLSNNEKVYISEKKIINMCINPNWMPYEKIENNKHIGITAEYISLIEKSLNRPIKLVKTTTWDESLEFSKKRKCDIISMIAPTDTKKQYLNFSIPYLKLPFVLATKIETPFINNINQIKNKKIGITQGHDYLNMLKNKYQNLQFVEVKNESEGLKLVNKNKLFGFIGTLAPIAYQIQKNYVGQLKIARKLNDIWNLSIGVRNDAPYLLTILNKSINLIPNYEYQKIADKWISLNYDNTIQYNTIFKWLGGIATLFFLILFVILRTNRKLNIEISYRKKIEQQLQANLDLMDQHIISSTTDLKGRITKVSTAFCEISGYSKKELIKKTHSIVRHQDMTKDFFKNMWDTIQKTGTWQGEIKNKRKNGEKYWVDTKISTIYDDKNNKIGYTSIRNDITYRKKLEEISITDELTQAYNRRYFNQKLPELINSAKRENEYICFALMDIDYFKLYNDTYGHVAGDDVLRETSKAIQALLHRADDYFFRLGGEEFGILLRGLEPDKAEKFLETIRANVENLHIAHEKNSASLYVTASFGLVITKAQSIYDEELLYQEADELLYKAKESGRNKVCVKKH